MWDILHLCLQEHCKKLFILIDRFWGNIEILNFDLKSLFKVRNHLEKLTRNLQKPNCKKLSNLSKNFEIKRLVLARFRKNLHHFKLKLHATSFYHPRSQNFRTESKGPNVEDFEGLNTSNKIDQVI